jgi:uncharacterized protein YprB with RNaseH-like and TPR domain
MNDNFEKKIRELGVHFGAGHLNSQPKNNNFDISMKDGISKENSMGKFFYVQKEFPQEYMHGNILFSDFMTKSFEFEFPGVFRPVNFQSCVFLDTETTGLALSAGTFAFMVGVAKIEGTSLCLRQYFLKSPTEEAAMLLDLSNFISPLDTIVTYNGIGFDIPILKHRYILHKIPVDFSSNPQLDLLKYSRALWRYQLDDRSLKSVEKNILHYQRTSDEVPGWMAPEIYREYLKTGNMSAILGVFYHNSMDVVSLCALMYAYVNVMIDKLDMHLDYQTINYALARLHEKHDNLQQSIQYYQDALAQTNLPNSIRINALNELSAIYKKSGDFEKAVVLWEMASEFNDVRSVIELAKYYEHRMREYESALYWVEKGIEVSKESNSYLMIELTHRKERILKKWSSNE